MGQGARNTDSSCFSSRCLYLSLRNGTRSSTCLGLGQSSVHPPLSAPFILGCARRHRVFRNPDACFFLEWISLPGCLHWSCSSLSTSPVTAVLCPPDTKLPLSPSLLWPGTLPWRCHAEGRVRILVHWEQWWLKGLVTSPCRSRRSQAFIFNKIAGEPNWVVSW